jgi:hypothetical protein
MAMNAPEKSVQLDSGGLPPDKRTVCIDWYSEGQSRVVEVDGVRIVVRFIGRKGRRGRIAIEAPTGAVFRAG